MILTFLQTMPNRRQMNRKARKWTQSQERTVNHRISLRIGAGWSECAPSAQRLAGNQMFLHANWIDAELNKQIHRLIWVLALSTRPNIHSVVLWSIDAYLMKHPFLKRKTVTSIKIQCIIPIEKWSINTRHKGKSISLMPSSVDSMFSLCARK